MRYFDTHLHLPSPDTAGLDKLRRHLDSEPGLVGGLLILNTAEEVDFYADHLGRLPIPLVTVPYFSPTAELPDTMRRSGWYKIHPDLQRIDATKIPSVVAEVRTELPRLKGLIVHCFPWGPNLRYCVSVPLVVALAQAFPSLPILATHGGGYESWALRAHTGSFPNVLYDFSVSLTYFRGSDLLRPLIVYAGTRPQRLLFGSDWPSAQPREQLEECARLVREVGMDTQELEMLLLTNARRYWAEDVPAAVSS